MMIPRMLALIFGLCLASAAHAQVVWTMAASNCVPTDVSIREDLYKTNVASVGFSGTQTGTIVLNCPVSRFDDDGGATEWQIGINYRDSTGTAPTGTVRARLFNLSVLDTSPIQLAVVTSNAAPNETEATVRSSKVFEHTFNFTTSYWIRLELDREAASEVVYANSVYIRFAPVVP